MSNIYSEIAIRELKKNKRRTITAIFTVVIVASLIIGMGNFKGAYEKLITNGIINDNPQYHLRVSNITADEKEKLADRTTVENMIVYESEKIDEITSTKGIDAEKVIKYNKEYFDYLGYSLEGRLPSNENEGLSLGEKVKEGTEIEIKVKGENKKVRLVGTLVNKKNEIDYAIVMNELPNGEGNREINGILKLNDDNIKQSMADIQTTFGERVEESPYLKATENTFTPIINVIWIVFGGILLALMVGVLYSTFYRSLDEFREDAKNFKLVGATSKQITNIILLQVMVILLIAIPISMILGSVGLEIVLRIVDKNVMVNNLNDLVINLNMINTLIGSIVVAITGYISALLIGRSINKKRVSKEFNGIGKDDNTSIENKIANRNINKKKSKIAIIAIAVMIIVLFPMENFKNRFRESGEDNPNYDISIVTSDDKDKVVKAVEEIEKNNSLVKNARVYYYNGRILGFNDKNKMFFNENDYYQTDVTRSINGKELMLSDVEIQVIDKTSEKFIKEYSPDFEYDKVVKDKGVVVVNDCDMGSEIERGNSYKVGDSLYLSNYVIDLYNEIVDEEVDLVEKNISEVKVSATIPYYSLNSKVSILVPIENLPFDTVTNSYKDENGQLIKDVSSTKDIYGIYIKCKENLTSDESEKLESFIKGLDLDIEYIDNIFNSRSSSNNVNKVINLICFGTALVFLIIVLLILSNIVTNNILDMESDLITLKEVGSSQKSMKKIVMKESLLYCLKGSIIGIIFGISISLIPIINQIFSGSLYGLMRYIFMSTPILEIVVIIIICVVVTYIIATLQLNKLNNKKLRKDIDR